MIITLDKTYYARVDSPLLGYMGETESRTITVQGYQTEGADRYILRFSYADGKQYDVDITSGAYNVQASLLRAAGNVKCQLLAVKSTSADTYEYVKKSNIFTATIKPSVGGDEPVPTYEETVAALEKVLAAEIAADECIAARDTAVTAAGTATEKAAVAVDKATEAAKSAEISAENASQTSADRTAVESDKAEVLSARDTAVSAADTATENAQTAIDNAVTANTAAETAVTASNAAQTARTAAEQAATVAEDNKTTAVNAAQTATQAADTAVSARDTAVAAQADVTAKAQTVEASAAQVAEDKQTVQEVVESIPADYSDLSASVDELKGDLGNKLDKYDLSVNRCDMNALTSGYSLNQSTGELYEASGWYVSDYCDISTNNESGFVTLFVKHLLSNIPKYAFYDAYKKYISGSNSYTNPLQVPANAKYIRVAFNTIDYDTIVNIGDTGVSDKYAYEYHKNDVIVPTKTSQLENDSSYVTSDDVVTKYTLDISINRLNLETTSRGNLNTSTGEILEGTLYISDYCDIATLNDTGLVTLYQNAGIKRNFQKVCFYDKDKKFVQGFTKYTNPVAIPSGAKYVIVQTNITTNPWIGAVVNIGDYGKYNAYHWDNLYYRNLSSYVNDVGYSINQWKGKSWSAYGDSITAISNGNGLQLGWAKYVNDVLGLGNFYGRGIGGQRFAWGNAGGAVSFINADGTYNSRNDSYTKDNYTGEIPEGTTACRGAFCSWDRITHMYPESIKDTIDLIFIMGGTNDSSDETSPVFVRNDVTDTEWASSDYYATYGGDYNISTLKGGIASCIMKMQVWMPQAVIVLGTPLSGRGNDGVIGTTIGTGEYIKSEYIKEVAKMCSIPLIDVYATCGINPWNRTKYISDSVHPYLEDGQKMLARAVIGGLMLILPMIY